MSLQIMLIIHIAIACFLIAIILLQQGKGADVGATFGGGGGSLFGAAGADNLLTRVTAFAAFGFMATSIILATMQRPATASSGGTLFDNLPETSSTAPATADSNSAGSNAVNGATSGAAAGSATNAAEATNPAADSSATTAKEAAKKVGTKEVGAKAAGTPIPEAAEPKVLKLNPGQNQTSQIEPQNLEGAKAAAKAKLGQAVAGETKAATEAANRVSATPAKPSAVVEQAVTDNVTTGKAVAEKVVTDVVTESAAAGKTITEKATGLVEKVVSEVEKKN